VKENVEKTELFSYILKYKNNLPQEILSFIRRVGNEIFPNLRDYIVLIACKGF